MPFNIKIINDSNLNLKRIIHLNDASVTAKKFSKSFNSTKASTESDQLILTFSHVNNKICTEYLNSVITEFNNDGIYDRQQEYKNTIEFVDVRSKILEEELEIIENQKKLFKEKNNLTDVTYDATVFANQQYIYNKDLFDVMSQRDLINLFQNELSNRSSDQLLPSDIGINDSGINDLIIDFNKKLTEIENYKLIAGPNNLYLKSLSSQLNDLIQNINESLNNYKTKLDITIGKIESKENEFELLYKKMPQNERF